jgi:hypothetical protein
MPLAIPPSAFGPCTAASIMQIRSPQMWVESPFEIGRPISFSDNGFIALLLSYSTTVTAIPLPWLIILLVTLPIRVCFPPAAPRRPTMIV